MTIGEKIKKLRNEAGMTQAELASKLGVRDAAVAKYETGRVTNLKRETIAKLSEVRKRPMQCDMFPFMRIWSTSWKKCSQSQINGLWRQMQARR